MKSLALISALFSAMSATTAYAQNTVFFQQTDQAGGNSVGIGTLIIQQSGSAANRIGSSTSTAFLKGGAELLIIRQLEANSCPNAIELSIYGVDTVSEFAQNRYAFNSTGSSNTQRFTLGAIDSVSSFMSISANTVVLGNSNSITEVFASGVNSTALSSNNVILGDSNIVNITSEAGVGRITSINRLEGSNNTLTVAYGSQNGYRDVISYIRGNANNWTLNSKSPYTIIDINQNSTPESNNVTGMIDQSDAIDSRFTLNFTKSGAGNFALNASQTAPFVHGNVNLTALGGGSFVLNQSATSSSYVASHTIASGGSATINQY